ncbi:MULTISPECIES: adenylyltransferase/cytidyltransferase family protein [Flavobacteriaceae]|uniref:adenylyltransferase/cytidyltransferase family protein n=1 Tax=Flavobacteriaceae TaxID=49546 RepID=UPI003AA81EB5
MKNKTIIGYTTGVFDLFHIGHLNILEQASKECDYLIVGVTACETVYKYKGRFPITPLEDRIAIVSSLKFVDKVVVQNSMDKISAWEEYNYNVLFHGDDWKNSPMYNEIEKKLSALGVKTKFFEYTKRTSTSLLKKKIYEDVKSFK